MFFPPIRSAFPQEIKKNNKYIAKHITTHTYTHKYFPKKNFHILITPCSQRTLMDSPLVMKMCTNLSLLYYYSIDQRLVMDRVQAQFSPPRYLPNNTTFLPFRAGPRAHPRAKRAKFRTITTQRPLLWHIVHDRCAKKKITPWPLCDF